MILCYQDKPILLFIISVCSTLFTLILSYSFNDLSLLSSSINVLLLIIALVKTFSLSLFTYFSWSSTKFLDFIWCEMDKELFELLTIELIVLIRLKVHVRAINKILKLFNNLDKNSPLKSLNDRIDRVNIEIEVTNKQIRYSRMVNQPYFTPKYYLSFRHNFLSLSYNSIYLGVILFSLPIVILRCLIILTSVITSLPFLWITVITIIIVELSSSGLDSEINDIFHKMEFKDDSLVKKRFVRFFFLIYIGTLWEVWREFKTYFKNQTLSVALDVVCGTASNNRYRNLIIILYCMNLYNSVTGRYYLYSEDSIYYDSILLNSSERPPLKDYYTSELLYIDSLLKFGII